MNWRYPRSRILVFARAPVKGRVKTRLIPALGEAGATALYERLLQQTLGMVRHSRLAPAALYCTPDVQHGFFQKQSGDFSLCVQQGRDLGERMATALAETLRNASMAILIGSDCPAMDAAYLNAAFLALDEHDVVIGPAEDGGYVLVGMKAPCTALFENIDWGSERVLAQTRTALQRAGLSWQELAPLPDIDDENDLKYLSKEIPEQRDKGKGE